MPLVLQFDTLSTNMAPSQSSISEYRVQPTVTFPIGDHVDVFHDYKKTRL